MENEYIVDGDIRRDKIAMDIKYRRLKRYDIERLCSDTRISVSFSENGYNDKKKKPKWAWSESYLDWVSCAYIDDINFNRDYLLYLDEVADYVSRSKLVKRVIVGLIFLVLVVIIIIRVMISQALPGFQIPEPYNLEYNHSGAESDE